MHNNLPLLACGLALALALALAVLASAAAATPSKREFSSAHKDTKLRIVKNSGVCETTPGVGQISGYIDVGPNMSMVRPSTSPAPAAAHLPPTVVLVLRSPRKPRDIPVHAVVRPISPAAPRRASLLTS